MAPPSLSWSAQLSDHEVNFMLQIQFFYVPHSITAGGRKQPLKRYPDVSRGFVPPGPPLSAPVAGRNQQLKQQHLLSLRLLQPYTCTANAWKSHFPHHFKSMPFSHQFKTSEEIKLLMREEDVLSSHSYNSSLTEGRTVSVLQNRKKWAL